MIKTIRQSSLVRFLVSAFVVYATAMYVIPQHILVQGLNWIVVTLAVAVLVAYSPGLPRAFVGKMDRVDRLTVGIFISWIAVALSRIWIGGIRLTDFPDWMRQSYIVSFYLFLSIIAAILHITALSTTSGRILCKNWWALAVALGTGLFTSGVAIGYIMSKNLSP